MKRYPLCVSWCALALASCSSSQTAAPAPHVAAPAVVAADSARTFAILDGETGERLGWSQLLDRVAEAEVIILGERHDDAGAHAAQLAVMEDVLDRWPRSSLSMEMLERHEQPLVDDYLDGIIDQPTFVEQTFSSRWGGAEGSWNAWYQPIVDAVKNTGAGGGGRGRVIAANAPRQYVRLANREGYDRLASLDDERQKLFAYPDPIPEGAYRDRFFELMGSMPGHGAHGGNSDEDPAAKYARLESGFKSQLVWDATMAESIARANPTRQEKVVHLIGQFHSDFDGGTVVLLKRRLPDVRVLTVSMQPVRSPELREEDRGRADIVIYTK